MDHINSVIGSVSALFLESNVHKGEISIILISLIKQVMPDCVLRLLGVKYSQSKNHTKTISVMS
jgi:Na+/H+ antiporter NhaC